MSNLMRDDTRIKREIELGFAMPECDMTFDEAISYMENNRADMIFFNFGCEDTAFRDIVFDAIAKYMHKSWKSFVKWANKVQNEYRFYA